MSRPFQPSLFDVGDPAPDESFSTLYGHRIAEPHLTCGWAVTYRHSR